VGALAAALHSSGHPASKGAGVVSLASIKSCYGHTEGAAGLTGLLLAAAVQQQQLAPPVVNLRGLNPYVSAALGAFRKSGGSSGESGSCGPAVPRQAAAACQTASAAGPASVAGTSSFGMSGVNAHALLSAAEAPIGPAAASLALLWQQQRYWPLPQQHRLLQLPRLAAASQVRFAAAVGSGAALGYLNDHRVGGRPLLPAAAMLEMAGAAGASLAEAATSALASAVASAAFISPCMLPAAGSTLVLLEMAVESRSGALQLLSSGSNGGAHFTASAVAAVVVQSNTPASSMTRSLAVPRALLTPAGQRARTAGSMACLSAPTADVTSAYIQHPAAADASLHLSALTSQDLEHAAATAAQTTAAQLQPRIPVAAGMYAGPTRSGRSSIAGWAAVKVGLLGWAACLADGRVAWH